MVDITTEKYVEQAHRAIGDPVLQKALAGLQERLGRGAQRAYRAASRGPRLFG